MAIEEYASAVSTGSSFADKEDYSGTSTNQNVALFYANPRQSICSGLCINKLLGHFLSRTCQKEDRILIRQVYELFMKNFRLPRSLILALVYSWRPIRN